MRELTFLNKVEGYQRRLYEYLADAQCRVRVRSKEQYWSLNDFVDVISLCDLIISSDYKEAVSFYESLDSAIQEYIPAYIEEELDRLLENAQERK